MAYYHVHGIHPRYSFPSEGYKLFEQSIASCAPKDNFYGFELIRRVHTLQTGEVFVICKSDSHQKRLNILVFVEQNLVLNEMLFPFLMMQRLFKKKQLAEEFAAMG